MKLNLEKHYKELITGFLLFAGVLLMLLSFNQFDTSPDSNTVARRTSAILEKRMKLLEDYMVDAHSQDISRWIDLGEIPEDMVIYRYCNDTLQSWVNEFPVSNDDIRTKAYMPFVPNPRISIISPLNDIGPEIKYLNLGPKWYLTKSIGDEKCRILAGLEINNTRFWGNASSINPKLKMHRQFNIRPISQDIGTSVSVQGQPVFVITQEVLTPSNNNNLPMMMIGVILLIAACITLLDRKRTLRRSILCAIIVFGSLLLVYVLGEGSGVQYPLFSPVLYADGTILYSLGAIVIFNLAVFYLGVSFYLMREYICNKVKSRKAAICTVIGFILCVLSLFVYSFHLLHSIILNSNISLQIYKFIDITHFWSILVYISFLTVLMSVPLLLQTVQTLFQEQLRWKKFDAFSLTSRIICSIIFASYLLVLSSVMGEKKEAQRIDLLAKRLSFDRDIALETRLRRAEAQIADDMIISALSVFNNTASSIRSRLSDYYLAGENQNYNISVYVLNSSNTTKAAIDQYNELIGDGTPIYNGSRFLYVKPENGHSYYVGVFLYLIQDSGVSRVLVRLDERETRGTKGYAGIFGFNPPGMVVLPNGYSYARYNGYALSSYKGNQVYSLKLSPEEYDRIYRNQEKTYIEGDTYHFYYKIGDNEAVIISRAKTSLFTIIIAGLFIGLVSFFAMSLLGIRRALHKKDRIHRSYYKNRISIVLMGSLTLIMLSMAVASIFFVYSRNDINQRNIMTDKIRAINSMIEAEIDNGLAISPANRNALTRIIEVIGRDTNSDITIYTTSGKLLTSTTPIVFESLMLGDRIDGYAYEQIYYSNKHHCIRQDQIGEIRYYNMYAPILDINDNIVAIMCSPYNEDSYDLEEDAVNHSMTMLSIFLLFLLMALFFITNVVDKLFSPLLEMSSKMDSVDLGKLDYIYYKRNDEISPLVVAYNRMVQELEDSAKKLAQAERDKAWSEMARQVAHEIKNPLTPMKLQLQRVIRLKQKGDENWKERFDEASRVLLDHIDILTDTANEFSTFAKLYTEESTRIDLNKLIKDEITMFDNKENIRFDYIGFNDVHILGPKPQLTRVFVNLINNSIQAIGNSENGRIMVSLRNSIQEGYYDIVFEDNGPGVSEENEQYLFTPNFTTKNGGSGLGLAISRSILNRCNASISYSRSFTLGGACFCITYPKEDLVA